MSGDIERVAKAISEHGGDNWDVCLKAPGQRRASMYRNMARAAIEAISVPSAAMIAAGKACDDPGCPNDGDFGCVGNAEEHWRAMAAEALK